MCEEAAGDMARTRKQRAMWLEGMQPIRPASATLSLQQGLPLKVPKPSETGPLSLDQGKAVLKRYFYSIKLHLKFTALGWDIAPFSMCLDSISEAPEDLPRNKNKLKKEGVWFDVVGSFSV